MPIVIAVLASLAAFAQSIPEGEIPNSKFRRSFWEDGRWQLEGNVEVSAGDAKILAESVVYDPVAKTVLATGDVVLLFPGATLSGSRLFYRIDEGTGEMDDVTGYFDRDNAILRARRAERLGPSRIRVEDAVFTACTQPLPYWSFRIHRGTFDLGEYAYLNNVAFKAIGVPVFYTPYLVWPIKTDRASGLLFPDFNNSDKLGTSFSLPFYWAFADNADVTFLFEAHTKVGIGLGAELDWLPTPEGRATGYGYWIDDQVRNKRRYRFDWSHRQELFGFDLLATIESVSDFDYFTDYETDLVRAASPKTLSRITATREWSWYTFTINTRRQLNYFVGGSTTRALLSGTAQNEILPEFEVRGRSRRIGKAPIYVSFEASASRFRRKVTDTPEGVFGVDDEDELVTISDDDWSRVDFAPRVSVPLVRQAWGDFVLQAGWRGTWYSARQDALGSGTIKDDALSRSLADAGFDFSGPRFQRVFLTPKWNFSPKLKHVIEPYVNYRFRPEASIDAREVIRTDEVDAVPSELSDFTYGIRQRFYVLRSPERQGSSALVTAEATSFEAMEEEEERQRKKEENENPEQDLDENLEVEPQPTPVEIGSLEITQGYSFVRDDVSLVYDYIRDEAGNIVFDALTGRPETEVVGNRSYTPVRVTARLNPSNEHTFDVSYAYDVANATLTETRVSTLVRIGDRSYAQGSWYRRRPSDPGATGLESYLRTRVGVSSTDRRLSLESELDYDLEQGELEHQAYLLRYASQCCTLKLGYDRRDFTGNSREELFLVVTLAGVGDILDLKRALTR
ncbi:MAG: LPS-assembly protein LptD [Acidobacteria bacterium]|nr:LPS-assembly protein LptD [Acidobacteriota bacterium]